MICTRGFEELLHKEPLLRLVDSAEQARAVLLELEAKEFDDGFATLRWQASQNGTWQARAAMVAGNLEQVRSPAMQRARELVQATSTGSW